MRRTWSENHLVLLQLERLKSVIRCEWHLCDARYLAKKEWHDNRRLYLSRFVQTACICPHIRCANIPWKYDFRPTMEKKNEWHKCLSRFAYTSTTATTTTVTETRVISDANFRNVAKCLKYEIVLLRIVLCFAHSFIFHSRSVPCRAGERHGRKMIFGIVNVQQVQSRRQIEWWT